MTSPFEAAGFRTAPFTVQTPQMQTPASPATNPVTNTQPQADQFQREELKKEVREEIMQELEEEQKKKEKKKPKKMFSGLNKMIAGFKKLGVSCEEYGKGLGRGIVTGGIVGGVGFGGMKLAQVAGLFKNVGIKAAEEGGKEAAKLGAKILGAAAGRAGKILRSNKLAVGIGIAGVVVGMAFEMWKASLNVNERNAKIEHRYEDESHMDS